MTALFSKNRRENHLLPLFLSSFLFSLNLCFCRLLKCFDRPPVSPVCGLCPSNPMSYSSNKIHFQSDVTSQVTDPESPFMRNQMMDPTKSLFAESALHRLLSPCEEEFRGLRHLYNGISNCVDQALVFCLVSMFCSGASTCAGHQSRFNSLGIGSMKKSRSCHSCSAWVMSVLQFQLHGKTRML